MFRKMQLSTSRWMGKGWVQDEKGVSLVETLVAVAILGLAVVAALTALSTGSLAVATADQETTAQSLARWQLEETKAAPYSATYSAITQPDYNISVGVDPIDVDPMAANIQKITVTVSRASKVLLVVEGYKVNR